MPAKLSRNPTALQFLLVKCRDIVKAALVGVSPADAVVV